MPEPKGEEMRRVRTMVYKKRLLLFFVAAFSALPGAAQDRKLVIPGREMQLGEVIREIERQSGYIIALNSRKLDVTRKVVLTSKEGSVEEILRDVLQGTGQDFMITGQHILIFPGKEKEVINRQLTGHEIHNPEELLIFRKQDLYSRLEEVLPERRAELKNGNHRDTVTLTYLPDGIYRFPDCRRSLQTFTGITGKSVKEDAKPFSRWAVKVNLLYGLGTLTPNISAETNVGNRLTLEMTASWNPWNRVGTIENNDKLVHWIVRPELRYWFCESFRGHFAGVHPFYWRYNIGGKKVPLLFEKEFRNDGNAWGIGFSYGYQWMWNNRWGIEMTAGAGISLMSYTKNECRDCGERLGKYHKTYVGPTSLGIKLIYILE